MLKVPEQAVLCFEEWSKTRVVLYDMARVFLPLMSLRRNIHEHPVCRASKIADSAKGCCDFDFWVTKDQIWQYPEGCLKLCHCGLLEWCMPVSSNNVHLCILEAGIRLPKPGVIYDFPMIREKSSGIVKNSGITFMDISEAELVMEGLRQLAARLQLWYELIHGESREGNEVPRHIQIYKFFQRNFRSNIDLSVLAKVLCLSPSRAAHVVKEITGRSFKEILNEYRMREICMLLQTTNQAVSEIAYNVGFIDISHFYRSFKKQFNTTPRQYRIDSRLKR